MILSVSNIIRGSCSCWSCSYNWGGGNNWCRCCLNCNWSRCYSNWSCRSFICIVGCIWKICIVHSWCHNTLWICNRYWSCLSHWCSCSYWSSSNCDRCSSWNWSSSSNWSSRLIHMVNWKVGGTNSKSKSIWDVVHCLDNTIRIHITVCTPDNSISSLNFLLNRITISITKRILSIVILSMILGTFWGRCCSNWSSLNICNRSSLNNWSGNGSLDNWCNSLSISYRSSLNYWSSLNHRCRLSYGSRGNNWSRGHYTNLCWSILLNGSIMSSFCSRYFWSINNWSTRGNRKVCSGHPKSCIISNVFHSLQNTISIHIFVCPSYHSI